MVCWCVGCSRERWTAGHCCALQRIVTSPWCPRANAAHAVSRTRAWLRVFAMTSPRLVRMNTASCASADPPGSSTAPSARSAIARSSHHTHACTHTHNGTKLLAPPGWTVLKIHLKISKILQCYTNNIYKGNLCSILFLISLSFSSEWTHLLLSGSFVPLAAVHLAKGVCTVVLHLKETHCFHPVPNWHLYTKCKLCIIPNWWPRMSLFISATERNHFFCFCFSHTEMKGHCSVQNTIYTSITTLDVKNHILSFRTVYETSKRIRDLS